MSRRKREKVLQVRVDLRLRPDQLVEFVRRMDAVASSYDKDYDYAVTSEGDPHARYGYTTI